MGTDREARALGAGDTIEVDGKTYTLRPITVRRLCDLEREALKYYKRDYLETYRDNLDLLDKRARADLLRIKLDEVAMWDVSNLPSKKAYDASNIPITDEIKQLIQREFDLRTTSDFICTAILSMALDTGKITPETIKEISGKAPRSGSVRYDQWWVGATSEGMARFVYQSLRGENDLTYEDVLNWNYFKLVEASRAVENITSAAMGNG